MIYILSNWGEWRKMGKKKTCEPQERVREMKCDYCIMYKPGAFRTTCRNVFEKEYTIEDFIKPEWIELYTNSNHVKNNVRIFIDEFCQVHIFKDDGGN